MPSSIAPDDGAALPVVVNVPVEIDQSHDSNPNLVDSINVLVNADEAAPSNDHHDSNDSNANISPSDPPKESPPDAPGHADDDHENDLIVHVDHITDDGSQSLPSKVSQSTTATAANPNESEEAESKNLKESEEKPSVLAADDHFDSEHEEKADPQRPLIELAPHHGHCSKQGYRQSMEDEVVVQPNFTVLDSKCTSGYMSLYGVFDGHGGDKCAAFCAEHLVSILSKYLSCCESVEVAFRETIAELDSKAIEFSDDASGSTCCIVLIDKRSHDLWCCNVGDSRCILMNALCDSVQQLSVEHKPDFPAERKRIESANGWVTFGRVCGILAVSRSLGDKDFKYEIKDLIVSTPDVTHHKVTIDEDNVIVLACDGLYDVFSNEQCMEWMRTNRGNISTQKLAEKLCYDAIYVRKSKDNVSILIIQLDHCELHEPEPVAHDETPPLSQVHDSDGQELPLQEASTGHDDAEHKMAEEAAECHSFSSTTVSSIGASITETDDVEESLNDSLSSGQSQDQDAVAPKKHKFHVVRVEEEMEMESEVEMEVDPPESD